MEKLIITIAPTGNVPTKALNPHAPLTVAEIVADIRACHERGASVAHIHARNAQLQPTCDRQIYQNIINGIDRERIDIIRQVSTGARGGKNTIDNRGQMLDLNVEMASLSTGSSNFPTSINGNSPELIRALAEKMYANHIKPEIEVFDTAMLYNALYLKKKGVLKGKLHFNLVMNVPGSLPGTPKNLLFLVDALPNDATFTVSGIGRSQISMLTMAIILGGHVRTGIEDILKLDAHTLATNALLVERIVCIAKAIGRDIATPEEARQILSL